MSFLRNQLGATLIQAVLLLTLVGFAAFLFLKNSRNFADEMQRARSLVGRHLIMMRMERYLADLDTINQSVEDEVATPPPPNSPSARPAKRNVNLRKCFMDAQITSNCVPDINGKEFVVYDADNLILSGPDVCYSIRGELITDTSNTECFFSVTTKFYPLCNDNTATSCAVAQKVLGAVWVKNTLISLFGGNQQDLTTGTFDGPLLGRVPYKAAL